MRFEVDGPSFAEEGDDVEIGDPIRVGDIVWFDRVAPQKVVMRVVAGAISGPCYLVGKGSESDSLSLLVQEVTPMSPDLPTDSGHTPLRDTAYATELARGTYLFLNSGEARLERLYVKEFEQVEIRFSWWKEGRMMMRPLDLDEQGLLHLIRDAITKGVFSSEFVTGLRSLPLPQGQ